MWRMALSVFVGLLQSCGDSACALYVSINMRGRQCYTIIYIGPADGLLCPHQVSASIDTEEDEKQNGESPKR